MHVTDFVEAAIHAGLQNACSDITVEHVQNIEVLKFNKQLGFTSPGFSGKHLNELTFIVRCDYTGPAANLGCPPALKLKITRKVVAKAKSKIGDICDLSLKGQFTILAKPKIGS